MKRHPYSELPASSYWRQSIAEIPPEQIDPVVSPPFRFSSGERVVTAGSCFAQHIGRYLKSSGANYLETERPHDFLSQNAANRLNYGVYSARYGNIYTARQLLQLFDRAYGAFLPAENYWQEGASFVLDPFRPQIQPGGFNSVMELDHDRERHFRAVREAFEKLDIFIFTLGLTEAWRSKTDGAVYPLCPGVAGGAFSDDRHEYLNFNVDEVVADMATFFHRLRRVNQRARIILSVSPVPLVATAENRHVLVSTVASKSILRVACDVLIRRFENVAYFPSYEIISGGPFFGVDYFGSDRRSVTEPGVAHAMKVFEKHFIGRASEKAATTIQGGASIAKKATPAAEAVKLMCEEEALAFTGTASSSSRGTQD